MALPSATIYMDLSVVIACTDAESSIVECLRRFESACFGIQAEFIVVDASVDATAAKASAFDGLRAHVIRLPPGTLAPMLWAEGYRQARGRVIAFTTGHCLVSTQWASSLIEAIDGGAAGAGGPLVLASTARVLDAAVYYLRYSAFMPMTLGDGRIAGEIAGDNAAYDRVWLDGHADSLVDGFWEVDFHRLVRAEGGWLAAVPAAVVQFGRSFPLATIVRQRFAHGAHFGAGRVRGGSRTALQIVLAAPLVPAVLAARAARRVALDRRSVLRFVTALPWFVVLASCWAAGEAWGAISKPSFGARVPQSRGHDIPIVGEHSNPSKMSNGAQV